MRGYWLRALWFSALVFSVLYHLYPPYSSLEVNLVVREDPDRYLVLFRSDDKYNMDNVIVAKAITSHNFTHLSAELPPVKVSQVRIDPGVIPGTILVKSICIKAKDRDIAELCFSGNELRKQFRPRKGIAGYKMANGMLQIEAVDGYPFIESIPELQSKILELSKRSTLPLYLWTICLSVLLMYVHARWTKISPLSFLHRYLCRPASFGPVLAAIVVVFFYFATDQLSRRTPPFQGPDETAHLSRLLAYENGIACGQVPAEFSNLAARVAHLPHHSERKLTYQDINRLTKVNNKSQEGTLHAVADTACSYNDGYVAGVAAVNALSGNSTTNSHPLTYLQNTRSSVSWVALILWLPSFLLVLRGRSLLLSGDLDVRAMRAAGFLSTVYMMCLPQTVWMSSIVSQDYLLIAVGQFVCLSLFFRLPFLSDMMLLFGAVAGASKVVYLIPFAMAIVVHYFLGYLKCKDRIWSNDSFSKLASRVAGYTAVIGGGVLLSRHFIARMIPHFCEHRNCYGVNDASLWSDWRQFITDIYSMLSEHNVLMFPHQFHTDSAFGRFGWLDTPLPDLYARVFIAPIWVTAVIGVVFFGSGLMSRNMHVKLRSCLLPGCVGVMYWAASFLAIYFAFVVMQAWCGLGSEFGCGYQRRYELPVYAIIPTLLFYVGFLGTNAICKRVDNIQLEYAFSFIFIFVLQLAVAFHAYRGTVLALETRYFETPRVRDHYFKLIDNVIKKPG